MVSISILLSILCFLCFGIELHLYSLCCVFCVWMFGYTCVSIFIPFSLIFLYLCFNLGIFSFAFDVFQCLVFANAFNVFGA